MTPELIGVLGVGVALATLIITTTVPALRELRRDVADLRERMAHLESDLSERMARLESDLSERMARLESDLSERMARLESDLSERMARLEGLFEGFTGRQHQEKTQ